jgi:hypothetical protein
MSAFDPLRTFRDERYTVAVLNKLPFSFVAERLRIVFLVLTLLIVALAVAAIWSAWNYPAGRLVEARVQRFGYIAGKLGDTPLITVRLPDGSQRQVLAK